MPITPPRHHAPAQTFGEASAVFSYEGEHEAWVDRTLNVIGSGFMHNRYFADMMDVHVRAIFDATPLGARRPVRPCRAPPPPRPAR